MNEDFLSSILVATFRGTNEEVKNATKELILLFNDPNFMNLLLSLIQNQKYEIITRKSASILVSRLILRGLIPHDSMLSFCQELSIVIEICEQELTPILKECSNQLIILLYKNSIDIMSIIFQLLSQDQIKSSLFYAISFINYINEFISNTSSEVVSTYKLFTSNYIHSLQEIFISILDNSELNETTKEFISLIFNFLSISTSYILPEIFNDYTQLQFWLPSSIEQYDVIQCDEYIYLSFLSNLPKQLIKSENDSEALLLINEIISWTCNNLNNYNYDDENIDLRCISMTFKIFYNLIKLNLFQFDDVFFIELLQKYILPNFNYNNLIEDNKPSSQICWLNLHDASLYLFEEIIINENQFLNVFYSLFENEEFIESDFFISSLDLYSFYVDLFYQIDPSRFISFLDQLQELIETSNEDNTKIVCLKIFSQIKNKRIDLPTEFLLNSITFSLSNIFNEESLVCYFAALASSSLIALVEDNENISSQILENESIIDRLEDLFAIFFELERDYQTEMITASLMKIINFFNQRIRPLLLQISIEIVDFFFNFASNRENHQPSILLASILCKLIEISEGDPQFIMFILKEILNEERWISINFELAFDKLFEILTTLIYYSTELLEDFCQIFPFFFEYLSENDSNNHLFGDIYDTIEMLIWKNSQYDDDVAEEIDSVLIEFLLQFLQSCDNFEEWIAAASLSIRIEPFSNMYEINLVLPKLLDFLSSDSSEISNPLVYDVVEHTFSFYSQTILTFDSEIVNFLFYDIYIKYARYPSFIDSFLKCIDSLPIEFKNISFQKAHFLVDKKIRSMKNEEEEEEEYYEDNDEDTNIAKPKWLDENEILINFSEFTSHLES